MLNENFVPVLMMVYAAYSVFTLMLTEVKGWKNTIIFKFIPLILAFLLAFFGITQYFHVVLK